MEAIAQTNPAGIGREGRCDPGSRRNRIRGFLLLPEPESIDVVNSSKID
jgi:predicted deacylase